MGRKKEINFYVDSGYLAKALTFSGLSREKFAQKINVTRRTLTNWEKQGGLTHRNWEVIEKLIYQREGLGDSITKEQKEIGASSASITSRDIDESEIIKKYNESADRLEAAQLELYAAWQLLRIIESRHGHRFSGLKSMMPRMLFTPNFVAPDITDEEEE